MKLISKITENKQSTTCYLICHKLKTKIDGPYTVHPTVIFIYYYFCSYYYFLIDIQVSTDLLRMYLYS